MADVPLSKQRATSDTISSLNKVDDWRMTEPAATAAPAKKKPKNGGKKRGNQNAQSRQTPASGKMPGFERFVESRLGKAGGTYKTLGTGGEVFRRGEFKGMTVEQALEKLRPEYSGLSGSEKSDWESQGAMNDVRSPGEGGRPFSEPPGPAGYNDRPTFSSNGPDTKFKMRSAAEVDSRNAQNRYEAGRNAVAAKKAEQASRTANLAYGATLSQNGNQRTLTDRNGKLIGYSGNAPSVPTAPQPAIAPPAPTVGNLNTSAGSFAPTVPLPSIGGKIPEIQTPLNNQNPTGSSTTAVNPPGKKPSSQPRYVQKSLKTDATIPKEESRKIGARLGLTRQIDANNAADPLANTMFAPLGSAFGKNRTLYDEAVKLTGDGLKDTRKTPRNDGPMMVQGQGAKTPPAVTMGQPAPVKRTPAEQAKEVEAGKAVAGTMQQLADEWSGGSKTAQKIPAQTGPVIAPPSKSPSPSTSNSDRQMVMDEAAKTDDLMKKVRQSEEAMKRVNGIAGKRVATK